MLCSQDGVSEGQFAPVVHEEVTQLKRAFRAIDPKWSPALTFVVCQKRHHVRCVQLPLVVLVAAPLVGVLSQGLSR